METLLTIASNAAYDSFAHKVLRKAASEKHWVNQEFCRYSDLKQKYEINNCRELIVEAAINALHELKSKLGEDLGKWKLCDLQSAIYPHNPFSTTPLARVFEHRMPIAGNRRTPYLSMYGFNEEPYLNEYGSVVKMIGDLTN